MILSLDEIRSFCKGKDFCLVGNASSVLCKEKDLDSYGVLARINRGAPCGKEQFIGSRTDILFLATRMEGGAILRDFNPRFVVWTTVDSHLASDWVRKNAVLNPWEDWCKLFLEIGSKPTTGAAAIKFILNHIDFQNLTIYGFDFFETPSWYNSQPGYRGPHDPFRDKAAVLAMIKGRDNVRLVNEA